MMNDDYFGRLTMKVCMYVCMYACTYMPYTLEDDFLTRDR
jgi:hypothetical protein